MRRVSVAEEELGRSRVWADSSKGPGPRRGRAASGRGSQGGRRCRAEATLRGRCPSFQRQPPAPRLVAETGRFVASSPRGVAVMRRSRLIGTGVGDAPTVTLRSESRSSRNGLDVAVSGSDLDFLFAKEISRMCLNGHG